MFLYVITTLILSIVCAYPNVSRNLTILNQTNAYERYPNLLNRIMCQNITDKYLSPLLVAADDVVIPSTAYFQSLNVLHGLLDCSAMQFSFTTIRTRNDLDPKSITLELMRHDDALGAPGTTFYKKTFPWPSNNIEWRQDAIAMPWQSMIVLQLNELGDDGVTRFNFHDPVFFPADRVWFSFYATVSQHINSVFRMNSMYWVTLNNNTDSTPVSEGSYDFVFRDVANLLHYNFVNWTTAKLVEPVMRIVPTTNNLAWTLSFTCQVSTQPTGAPTNKLPLAPTTTPMPTIEVPSGNHTNITHDRDYDPARLAIAIATPLTIVSLCLLVWCFLAMYRKWRRRQAQVKNKSNIMNLLISPNTDDPFKEYVIPNANPLKQQPPIAIYTSGKEWVPVPLGNDDASKGLFNNVISTDDEYY
jgi:hypothetical protein